MSNFTIADLCRSSTAERLNIDNTPPADVLEHLTLLAQGLEEVEMLLGHPLHLDSAYRCHVLNKAVCGAPNSAHVLGYAADFICPPFGSPKEIVNKIWWSDIQFDQIIYEGSWVHISFDPKMRRESLTAHFGPNGTTYT